MTDPFHKIRALGFIPTFSAADTMVEAWNWTVESHRTGLKISHQTSGPLSNAIADAVAAIELMEQGNPVPPVDGGQNV